MIYGIGERGILKMEFHLKCKRVKDILIGEEMYYNKCIWKKIEPNNKDSERKYGVFLNISNPRFEYDNTLLSDDLIVIIDEYILCKIESENKKLNGQNNS